MAIEQRVATTDHFDPVEYDRRIEEDGTPAIWRRARTCPCINRATGQAKVDCPVCFGDAVFWGDGEDIKVLAPGRQRKDEYDVVGAWMQGMLMLSFPSTALPGHLDRVELTLAKMVVDNELLVKGASDRAGRSKERLRFRHALDVEACHAIVDGELREYAVVNDFSVDAAGVVRWVDGHGPPDGAQYSMRYVARPTYLLWSPQSRDEGGLKMPYRCMAQRLDFFRRSVEGVG